MKHETYKGRKLKTLKGKEYGYVQHFVNGVSLGRHQGTEESALQSMRATIDHVDTVEFARYGVEWYAPGTAEACEECTASKAPGSVCVSDWCIKRAHAEALSMNEEFDAAAPVHPACICPVRTDYHTEDCQRFQLVRSTDTKENTMAAPRRPRDVEGPLTHLELEIIQSVAEGEMHSQIAKRLNKSRQYVSDLASNAMNKMQAASSQNSSYVWGQYRAYIQAAALLESEGVVHAVESGTPLDPAEEHANHVVLLMAALLRKRAEGLLPK